MATIKVPVTKAKGEYIEIDTRPVSEGGDLPDAVYQAALAEGLKAFINRRMSKISVVGLEGKALEEAKAAAMKVAQENLENMRQGKIKTVGGAKGDKVSGAVMTEARRMARNIIKDELKRAGEKLAYYSASEITKSANALILANPEIVDRAKASLAERDTVKVPIDIKAIPISADKKAAAEKARVNKKAKATLSAAQAGKTAKRSKPVHATT